MKKKGFTLIELLVVISIIAILATIILANLQQARSKARDSKRISDISQLQLALALYLNKFGEYPKLGSTNCGSTANQQGVNLLKDCLVTYNQFIGDIPTDPLNDATHKYGFNPLNSATPPVFSTTEASGYCLSAVLENTSSYVDQTIVCDTDTTVGTGPLIFKVQK